MTDAARRVADRHLAADNEPTNESLWEKCKATAKARYTKWPSAYAVGHALKLYKDEGGGWKKKAAPDLREARGKAKKDVGHGGLDEWFSGHGEGKSKGEGEATWGDWVAISPVKKKIETELADGTVKTETVYPGDIVGPCGVSEDANWKDVTKGGKDPLKCMPRQKAYDMDKSERAELAKAKMKAEKSEGNGKKPVMTPTFQKDKEAASLAERVATRALEAADIPPEKVRELMLKIRKGATSSLTLPQLDAVLRSLGAKVDTIVGFVPSKSRIHNDTLEDAEETLEKVKKFQVPSLPAKPKPGMLYVTKIYPIDTKALYPQVEFDSAVSATGIRIVMPDGKKGEILPTESQIYKPKEIINLGGKSAPKSSVPVYEVERWLGKETDWIARIDAFLGMEEHIPAEARTRDRTGSCPVCFQNVKLSARNEIVLHGYQRPGYGFVQGKCPGVGSPPFEISPKGTETYLKNVLEPGVKSLKAQVKLLLSGKVDSIQYKGKLIDKKSPSWDFLLAKKKESAEADLQQAIEDRDAFTNLVQNWKERPLPKEGERLINWFIQGQKSASLRVLARYMEAAGKYDDIDFKPPESVAAEAKKGLEYREKASPSNKGGLTPAEASEQGIGSGVQRAVNLKNRDNVTPETISKMVGFFARHEKNKGVSPENEGKPWNDKGHVAWLLWGGDPGKSWAEKVKAQMDKADEQSKTAARPPVGPKPASPSQISYAKSLIEQGTRGLRGVPAWLSPEDAPTDKQLAEMDGNAISTLIDSLKSRKPFEVERYGGGGYKVTRKASPERVADRFLMGR